MTKGHDENMAANNKEQQPKKKRGPSPIIVPKHISDWARRGTTNYHVNNYKKGGGYKPWNGR